MIAYEAFIRRASEIKLPFMLKGSYVTRQYFPAGVDRFPADLDWVYMDYLEHEADAEQLFTDWVTQVTELELNDDVKFRSFKENEFWRMMDYAMADDFPTVNTDLLCWVNNEEIEFTLDISFNLDIPEPTVSLLYQPIQGELFTVPDTVPLSLQVSWKVHQTLVRPRFKDLFDLIYLLKHPSFNQQTLTACLQALINECKADNIDLIKLNYFLTGQFERLFPINSIKGNWELWRHKIDTKDFFRSSSWGEGAEFVTDVTKLPAKLDDFLLQLSDSLKQAGLVIELMNCLPEPTLKIRKTYKDMGNSYLSINPDLKPFNDSDIPPRQPISEVRPPNTNNSSIPTDKSPGLIERIRRLFGI